MNRRSVVALAVVIVVGCSESGTSPPPTSSPVMTAVVGQVTVTETGCAYEGLHHPPVGKALIRLVDQRGSGFNAHLWLFDEGYRYPDWAAGFLVDHATLRDHAKIVSDGQAPPNASGRLLANFVKGTYGILCVPLRDGREYGVGYTTGPITVPPTSASASPATHGVAPSARGYAAMSDAPGSGVLLFGGFTSPPTPDFIPDMWAYRPHDPKGPWQQIQPGPVPSVGDLLICIADCALLVYLTGDGTWLYDVAAGRWQKKGAGHTLHGMSGAYDSESRRLIVFGGDNVDQVPIDETWAYDPFGDRWTQMHPKASPPARFFHGMAYDPSSDRVVAFGGFGPNLDLYGDTWTYDFNRDIWTEAPAGTGPTARAYLQMAYDPTRRRTVLYGGTTTGEATLDDTWTFESNQGSWSELEAAFGPGPRAWHGMAYDAVEQSVVIFGGGASRSYDNDVWLLSSTRNYWIRGS